MINEKQPFNLRCSILYCFECYLYKNEKLQSDIINTLLPQQQQPQQQQITTGQLLCTGLFSQNDFVANWLCAAAIAHTVNENSVQKEQLLRVQLSIASPNANNNNSATPVQPISLMQQCMLILSDSNSNNFNTMHHRNLKFQTAVSLLMLLATWLSNCSNAVNYFLAQPNNVSYLISQASSADAEEKSLMIQGLSAFLLGICMLYNTNQVQPYTVDNLKDTIKKRIGIEQFKSKLEFISQHDIYTRTLKKPMFAFKRKNPSELLFDYEFTRLFKYNESMNYLPIFATN